MPMVKLGASRQLAVPKKLTDQLGLTPGDYLEIEEKNGRLILTPKALIDKRLAQALDDVRKGKVIGPFKTAKEKMRALKAFDK